MGIVWSQIVTSSSMNRFAIFVKMLSIPFKLVRIENPCVNPNSFHFSERKKRWWHTLKDRKARYTRVVSCIKRHCRISTNIIRLMCTIWAHCSQNARKWKEPDWPYSRARCSQYTEHWISYKIRGKPFDSNSNHFFLHFQRSTFSISSIVYRKFTKISIKQWTTPIIALT